MQTKKVFVIVILLFGMMKLNAQQDYTTVNNNDRKLPMKQSTFSVKIVPDENSSVFGLEIDNPEKKDLRLEISHKVMGTVMDTTINSELFARRYNLTNVEDGRYVIIVKNGKEKVSKEIELNTVMKREMVIY